MKQLVCQLNDAQREVSELDKFTLFLQKLDILQNVTDEEVQKTETLLRVYGPMLRAAAQSLGELDEMCYEGRRQSITDFINLAIDYDHDTDRKRIAERLTDMGHSMQLLSILESALLLVKEDQRQKFSPFGISTRVLDQMKMPFSPLVWPHLHTTVTPKRLCGCMLPICGALSSPTWF